MKNSQKFETEFSVLHVFLWKVVVHVFNYPSICPIGFLGYIFAYFSLSINFIWSADCIKMDASNSL